MIKYLNVLCTKEQIRMLVLLLIGSLITVIFEFISIGSIPIFTSILINQNNENPLFESIENNDYRVDSLSPAIGKADLAIASTVPYDIIGNSRLPLPDVGAYQFIPGQNVDDKSLGPVNHMSPIKKLTHLFKRGNYPKLK